MKKNKDLKKYADYEKSRPEQLSLFELDTASLSNTIELFDMLPLYVWGKVKRTEEGFAKPIRRSIEYKDVHYDLVITPAQLEQKDGDFKAFFPGKDAFAVLQVLRYFLTKNHKNVFLDGQAAVKFTLYQIQQYLKDTHNEGREAKAPPLSTEQIKQALYTLSQTFVKIKADNVDGDEWSSPIIVGLGLKRRKNWQELGGETFCFAVLHPMITNGILQQNYRPYYINDVLAYKHALSKYLHIRMSHTFIQASIMKEYHIDLVTWFLGAGVKLKPEFRKNVKVAETALKEMREAQNPIIARYTTELKKEGRKIVGAIFHLMPTIDFVSIVKGENIRRKQIRDNRF